MGQRAPAPRLLRLKPEDSRVVKGAHLAKGKFTWITESGKQERWIVVSCGNYTVLWNFRSEIMLLSPLPSYKSLSQKFCSLKPFFFHPPSKGPSV